MAGSDWIGYVGAVAGIIGAVTGIVGAVTGGISLYKTTQLKALDLRLQLKTGFIDARHALDSLPDLITRASTSRERIYAAGGQAGARLQWAGAVDADRGRVTQLEAEMPDSAGYGSLNTVKKLEAELVRVHGLNARITTLVEKYEASLAEDAGERKEIARRAHQAAIAATYRPGNERS